MPGSISKLTTFRLASGLEEGRYATNGPSRPVLMGFSMAETARFLEVLCKVHYILWCKLFERLDLEPRLDRTGDLHFNRALVVCHIGVLQLWLRHCVST